MSNYMRKWSDTYRLRAPYDLTTGEFPRKKRKDNSDAELCTEDVYIECYNDDMIYDINSSKGILQAYFSSRQRGRKVVNQIVGDDFDKLITSESFNGYHHNNYTQINQGNYIIFDISENDSELWFSFKGNKDLEYIAKLMKAKKPMSSKTPFNNKYLPSHKEKLKLKRESELKYIKYDNMPKGYWDVMKNTIQPAIAKKHNMKIDQALKLAYVLFGQYKDVNFIIEAKNNNYKTNHYIHKLGLWDEFINYLLEYIK